MTKHLAAIQIDNAPDTTASVIWMHGLGAHPSNFTDVPDNPAMRSFGAVRFIFPYAPFRPVTVNNGLMTPAWFDVESFDFDRFNGEEDAAGIRQSQVQIEQLIEQEMARGVPSERIIVAGFSQGGIMSLHTGLRFPHRLGGLMCLSGYLPLAGSVAAERHSTNADTPIFMAHGRMDPVIPFHIAARSRDKLHELGYQPEWHEYNMPHSTCPEEIKHIGAWLRGILG